MTAPQLLDIVRQDSYARLKWQVLRRLGLCPASLRARLLSRRSVLRLACQMILDDAPSERREWETNPYFDMAGFQKCLAGS